MIADYLSAEAPIIARLRAEVSGLRTVLGAADIAELEEAAVPTPAAFVIYDGDEIPEGEGARAGAGTAQRVTQRWYVVVAVRNARDALGGSAARAEAGPLISQAIAALAGWQPTADHRPLRRAGAVPPGFSKGFGYFPILFTTEVVTS